MTPPMTRAEALNIIDSLYPADSHHATVAQTGRRLLEQARSDVAAWRDVDPDIVLVRYAELCLLEEQYQAQLVHRRSPCGRNR